MIWDFFSSLKKTYVFLFGSAVSLMLCRLSLVAASRGYSLGVVHGLLIVGASLVVEHGL